jgi:hypothetical protein
VYTIEVNTLKKAAKVLLIAAALEVGERVGRAIGDRLERKIRGKKGKRRG